LESNEKEVIKCGNKLIFSVREQTNVVIYTLNGTLIRTLILKGIQDEAIDINGWKQGLYLLQLQSNNKVRNMKMLR
jgi:hypothetical protein